MNRVYEISMLLDFYGQMLTDRQYEILDMHYNNDYSLGEIAEHLEISRQGVYDNIKRGRLTLENLENKLGLVKKFTEQKNKAQEILVYLENVSPTCLDEDSKKNLSKIRDGILDIINKF